MGVVDTNNNYYCNNVITIIIILLIYGKHFLKPATSNAAHPKTNNMDSSKLRSSLRSTPAMSIEDTSKDHFIIIISIVFHNEYYYLFKF